MILMDKREAGICRGHRHYLLLEQGAPVVRIQALGLGLERSP